MRMNLSDFNFTKVMNYPDDTDELYIFDFSEGYDEGFIRTKEWAIGRYNEERAKMYETQLFEGKRNIHVGIDIWAKMGEPVYSFYEGEVAYKQDNNQPGDYGPTIVIKYTFDDNYLYALYGHLSRPSLSTVSVGDRVARGQKIGELGGSNVNGGWAPHLHFQLSVEDPGEADMPGVVAPDNREAALEKYPDPRIVLGNLY